MRSTADERRGTGRGTWMVAGAGVVALATALVVVLIGRGSDEPASHRPDGIAHVHGLDIDPRDGSLLVATHHGLFRLAEDGTAAVVSDDPHDFMGFTVVDADRFLASGHPAPGTDARRDLERPLFGLIESTDGGATWTAASLSGEADFHALEAAHGLVYGFDATNGRFLVGSDGSDWDLRSETPMADLAVDPTDPDRIVASGARGLIESADGGRTWQRVAGAPLLVFLDWHADRGLWGLDVEGRVHRLEGGDWDAQQALGGPPQALLVHDGGIVAAVQDGATVIHRSDDGERWTVAYRDHPSG